MTRNLILRACAVATATVAFADPVPTERVPMHDPSLIVAEGRFYVFGTGTGVAVWSSSGGSSWTHENPVFAQPPAWAVASIPAFEGHVWAPDITFHGGRYYLYYAVSAFGKNTSAIGVATNATLDVRKSGFHWEDHGPVIRSVPGRTNWNAIDPNLVFGSDGTPYLAFGSFWSGLKIVRLKENLLEVADPGAEPIAIASRVPLGPGRFSAAPAGEPADAGGNAIEAAFIYPHAGSYYLFASIDYCCRGPRSNYKMVVGKAALPTGPYRGRDGRLMTEGGGTLLLAGDRAWYGVGHNSVAAWAGHDYAVFHGYAVDDGGRSRLRIEPISWTEDGWPELTTAK
jgi:arabinan endo-1,5-alpha-L-arabinosidase